MNDSVHLFDTIQWAQNEFQFFISIILVFLLPSLSRSSLFSLTFFLSMWFSQMHPFFFYLQHSVTFAFLYRCLSYEFYVCLLVLYNTSKQGFLCLPTISHCRVLISTISKFLTYIVMESTFNQLFRYKFFVRNPNCHDEINFSR